MPFVRVTLNEEMIVTGLVLVNLLLLHRITSIPEKKLVIVLHAPPVENPNVDWLNLQLRKPIDWHSQWNSFPGQDDVEFNIGEQFSATESVKLQKERRVTTRLSIFLNMRSRVVQSRAGRGARHMLLSTTLFLTHCMRFTHIARIVMS